MGGGGNAQAPRERFRHGVSARHRALPRNRRQMRGYFFRPGVFFRPGRATRGLAPRLGPRIPASKAASRFSTAARPRASSAKRRSRSSDATPAGAGPGGEDGGGG